MVFKFAKRIKIFLPYTVSCCCLSFELIPILTWFWILYQILMNSISITVTGKFASLLRVGAVLCIKCSFPELSPPVREEQSIKFRNLLLKHFYKSVPFCAPIGSSGRLSKRQKFYVWVLGLILLLLASSPAWLWNGWGLRVQRWRFIVFHRSCTWIFFWEYGELQCLNSFQAYRCPFYATGFQILCSCVFIPIRWVLSCWDRGRDSLMYFEPWG